jgi:hypothetical protein
VRRQIRRLFRSPESRDRGGVALIVAVAAGCGLLMAAGALVVDIGLMHAEREQLQSAADASAIKIAQVCAADSKSADCSAAAGRSAAASYANANSNDGMSDLWVICGRGGGLLACSPSSPQLLGNCVKDAPSTGNYVEVRTTTRISASNTTLPPAFAGALVKDYRSKTLTACARAAWGGIIQTTGISVTISICEWRSYVGTPATFPNPPRDVVIHLHDTTPSTTCPAGPANKDVPGGFGWLVEDAGPCKTAVKVNGTYGVDPGNSASQGCRDALVLLRKAGKPVFMPVYNDVLDEYEKKEKGRGNEKVLYKSTYTIAGFAAFVLTGWDVPGSSEVSSLTKQRYCSGSDTCLYGYFIKGLLPATGTIGGPDLGASIVSLVG